MPQWGDVRADPPRDPRGRPDPGRARGALVACGEAALGAQELERICRGECYRPSGLRRRITRIEVVRIRPQRTPDEPIAKLIDDPWKVLPCEPDLAGCSATFTDPDFVSGARPALYYVRAFEEEALGVNAGGARCERDAAGECLKVNLCGADPQDDCLTPREPRAGSSPIWLGHRAEGP